MDHREHDEVLRDIVRSVEQNSDMDPNHPDLLTLKRILLEKISPAEAGDSTVQETIACSVATEALPVGGPVSQALGLGATGDAPALPTDQAVSQALGLGTTTNQPGSPVEAGDGQPSNPSAATDPSSPPPIEGA